MVDLFPVLVSIRHKKKNGDGISHPTFLFGPIKKIDPSVT